MFVDCWAALIKKSFRIIGLRCNLEAIISILALIVECKYLVRKKHTLLKFRNLFHHGIWYFLYRILRNVWVFVYIMVLLDVTYAGYTDVVISCDTDNDEIDQYKCIFCVVMKLNLTHRNSYRLTQQVLRLLLIFFLFRSVHTHKKRTN